jgi:protein involved in polysaccharide export with SLBB domain
MSVRPLLRGIFVLVILGIGLDALAQIQLTPAQQQMLNSLPPAQRQQAMEAIEQLNAQGVDGLGDTQSTIRETDETTDLLLEDPLDFEFDEFEEPRAAQGSELVITLTPQEALSPEELIRVDNDPLLSRLSGSGVYTLDQTGTLTLPGLDRVVLLGLNEEDIERRLGAESLLDVFEIDVRILELEAYGTAALKPFGYELFVPEEGSLTPPQSGPVPPDYVLGPGDMVRVQLFGNVNGEYEFEVSRDGILNLPELGPVTVAGIPFSEFRRDLTERVSEMLIGTQASVTMGPLRTIRVFVLGDVNRPGSYIVPGLGTISSALYRSGGISEVGSLRNVQLKRSGQVITTLDLYELLLAGDNSSDLRLQPGDVIFVPPVGDTVGVSGAVRRPAIYELRGNTTAEAVVRLAGGLVPEAFAGGARLERIGDRRERRVLAVDLASPAGAATNVSNGDTLIVPEVLAELENAVTLSGHVQRPGPYQWFPGMRLTDLITSPLELKPGVDDGYVLVKRERIRGEPIEVFSADVGAALRDPASPQNIELGARDIVHVFSLSFGRQRVVKPLLEELQRQATFEQPFQRVEIVGNVRAPGTYPLEPGMRVRDLIRAGGNLAEEAFTLTAELTRYTVEDGSLRQAEVVDVSLDQILRGDEVANFELRPHDHLSITQIPEWQTDWSVSLDGEVRFPGEYRIRRGENLASVLERAGGLTDAAFPEGAVFLRESLKEREREQVDLLARRLESDLVSLSLQSVDTSGSETLQTGQALLKQLRNYEPVGRLVIDINTLQREGINAAEILELRDGDQLLVPQRSQVVTVIGEAQQNTSHLFQSGLSRDDYIELSGGLTRRADKKLIYVVKASGAVVTGGRSRWLGSGKEVSISPGDTIVIPLDTDRIRPLTFWTNVTQILYQGAIAVAAISAFRD